MIFEIEGGQVNFYPHGNNESATFDVEGAVANINASNINIDTVVTTYLNITKPVARELAKALSEWANNE